MTSALIQTYVDRAVAQMRRLDLLPIPTGLDHLAQGCEERATLGYVSQVAVQRGPLIYCLESADLPNDTRILEVAIPPDIRLSARYDARLLGGVAVLEGTAEARRQGEWKDRLYREVEQQKAAPMPIRLVPYYAWGNRGPGEMTVWMPRTR
jgi:DUF1680 family protein